MTYIKSINAVYDTKNNKVQVYFGRKIRKLVHYKILMLTYLIEN